MFEDSLVESRVAVISPEKRWTAVASVALQATLAAVVIALPLLHPEGLPTTHVDAPKVVLPLMPRPPVPVVVTQQTPSGSASSFAPPVETRALIFTHTPGAQTATNEGPVLALLGVVMGGPPGVPGGLDTGEGHGPAVSIVTPKPTGPLKISSISSGMLLTPIRPVYPAIARAAGVQGSVVVEAVISKTGVIESLYVVSGPMMLQNAALEAIREARYKPYRLNGEPVDVQTTITVNFRMGG
jgi:protein TonB